ncbi:MAG: hypothetical protein ACETWE_02615 [Candidatus Bathyarchaeia archaeon]
MPLKIDLGKVVPGLFIFIFGIALFAVWALASLISLFIGIPYLSLLLILALAFMIGGVIQVLSGVSGIFDYIRSR